MNPITVTFVRLPEAAREPAAQAARTVWPRARFVTARSVAEATGQPAAGRQLLVLGAPDEAETGLAVQTLEAGDLPRWAVVCLGGEASDLAETIPPEDWNVALLAQVFRATLLQHELLRENLQLRGDLKTIARRVSHDARTPLGCIQTLCELIQHAPPADAAALRDNLDVIRNSVGEINLLVDRMSSLVRATLDPLPSSVFPMGTVVESALRQLQPELDASAKKIRPPAQWPEADGIMEWTELIWWNLIRNALAHGSRTGVIQLGWTRDGGALRFWVSSPGAVAPESFPRLLRRFSQLHQHPSAGFGLSVVERLVTLQGGQCGYETADGDRAVFFFTLRGSALPAKEGAETRAGSMAERR